MKLLLPLRIIVFISIFFPLASSAQTLQFFDINQSKFPIVSAKFNALDNKNQLVNPPVSELTLTENGKQMEIVSVTCPEQPELAALSSVVMVDVSGSMQTNTGLGLRRLDLAKTAAVSWINGLPQGLSEAAVGTFNSGNYFNQDFTTDRQKLLAVLPTLQPSGGTDYNMGLLKPFAGALQISQNGKYQKVIIYITDGLPNFEPDVKAIIAEAKKQDCKIFAITLGLACPMSLKEITAKTNGQYFENVTTQQQAETIYMQILQTSQSSLPCEIVWKSSTTCKPTRNTAYLQWKNTTQSLTYEVTQPEFMQMTIVPKTLAFKSPAPIGQAHDTTITVTAASTGASITDIKSTDNSFDIFPKQFNLLPNQSRQLTVRYTPRDSSYYWTSFIFETLECTQTYFASARFPYQKPGPQTTKMVVSYPNNGEVLAAGSDDTLRWNGIPATDTVTIEITNDNGLTWRTITNQATGLEYKYRFPAEIGNQYRIRITQREGKSIGSNNYIELKEHTDGVNMVDWSPDRKKIATVSDDSTAIIWDAITGKKLHTLNGQLAQITHVQWHPGGLYLATSDIEGKLMIWDSAGQNTGIEQNSSEPTSSLAWSLDGSQLISSYIDGYVWVTSIDLGKIKGGSAIGAKKKGTYENYARVNPKFESVAFCLEDSNKVGVYSLSNFNMEYSLKGHTKLVRHLAWDPDGVKLATASDDRTIKIWDALGNSLKTLTGHFNTIREVAWSPDGKMLASISDDQTCCIWDPLSGERVAILNGHNVPFSHLEFSPDGQFLATSNLDGSAYIWNLRSGYVRTLDGHIGEATYVAWNFDGSYLASSGKDGVVRIWDATDSTSALLRPIQTDMSDTVFTLNAPTPTASDIEMGIVSVGNSKDTVIVEYLRNTGTYPYRIDSMTIANDANSEFTAVQQSYPIIVPVGSTQSGEFLFTPISAGAKKATIKIYTQANVLLKEITGFAIVDSVQIKGSPALFGQVDVGTQKDFLRQYMIVNHSKSPVTVSMSEAGPNIKDYSILGITNNYTIKAKDSISVDVRFAPKELGRTGGGINFDFKGVRPSALMQMFGEGVPKSPLAALLYSVNMGTVNVGYTKDSLAVLIVKNKTGVPVALPNVKITGTNPDDFSVLDNTQKIIKPYDQVKINIRFSPQSSGYKYAEAVFLPDSNSTPVSVTILGKGTIESNNIPATVTLQVGSATAKAGDTVSIPIMITSQTRLAQSKISRFTGVLHYNSALLETVGTTPNATITNGQAAIEFGFPIVLTSDTQIRYSFKAKANSEAITAISIDRINSTGGVANVKTVNGEFRLLPNTPDTTHTELSFEQIQLGPLTPNPAQNSADVVMRIIEKGISKLSLIDANGRTVKIFINKEIPVGLQTLHLDVSDIGIGHYFLRLQTPTQEQMVQMEIQR